MYISREAILNIALNMERKGIEFYGKMKGRIQDDFVDFLIEEEKKHIRTFEELFDKTKGKLGQEQFVNNLVDDNYLAAAYASTEVFGTADPDSVPEGELFSAAIEMEKNSILFYADLADALIADYPAEAALVDEMKKEEQRHLRTLVLAKLDRAAAK